MKKWYSLVVLIALVSWGCAQPDAGVATGDGEHTQEADGHDHDHGSETVSVAHYCGDCGFEKGSDDCCAEGAEKCAACNMSKGSTLCCKLEGDFAGKELCGKCGDVAGTESCCDEDAAQCADCGLTKGAVLCCKLAEAGQESHEDTDG